MSDDRGRPWPEQHRGRRVNPRASLPADLDPRRGVHRDPPPYPPGPPGYSGTPPWPPHPGPRPPRSGRARAALGAKIIATGLSVAVVVASAILWSGYRKYTGQISRLDAIPAGSDGTDIDGEDLNILLVGNDSRNSAADEQLAELGTERSGGTANTDTMIIAHIPADGSRAKLVSFPRDLWVEIPEVGMRKLNAAYPNGSKGGDSVEAREQGAQLLVQTISEFSGLHIDHYVEVDLLGFYNITNALDGVEVNLCQAQQEKDSGIDLPAGKQTLKGKQALAFVRQRKGLPRGDLDRIQRQQYFIGAVVNKMISADMLLNLPKLNKVLNEVTKSLHTDQDFDPLRLAKQVRDLAAGNVEFMTVPNTGSSNIDGQSVVLPDEDAIAPFFASLSEGAEPEDDEAGAGATVPRDQVRVEVQNATGRGGLAGRTASALEEGGFGVTGVRDADPQEAVSIRYAEGEEAAARTLATVVPGAELEPDDSLGSGVVLVLGSSFTELNLGPGSGSGGGGAGGGGGGAAEPTKPDRTAADTGCIN